MFYTNKLAVLIKKDAKILVFEYYRYHHFREVKGKKDVQVLKILECYRYHHLYGINLLSFKK